MKHYIQYIKLPKYISRIPEHIVYILFLFLVSRFALTVIGVNVRPDQNHFNIVPYNPIRYSESRILNMWGRWDSEWYLNIARSGYNNIVNSQENNLSYAFFPVFPMLISVVSKLLGFRLFTSAIIVSNIFFICSSLVLYKLTALDTGKKESLRTVKYLFLLPLSFLYSAALSEGVFLFLLVSTFYLARLGMWKYASLVGVVLSLTRPVGVLVLLPLIAEYLDSEHKTSHRSLFWFTLVPLGLLCFMLFNYLESGDPLMFIHIQKSWGRTLDNPFLFLFRDLINNSPSILFNSVYTFILLCLISWSFNKIRSSYWILLVIMVIIPLSTGLLSILRITLPIFPICIALARMAKNENIDQLLTIFLSLFQGALVVAWIAGSFITM